MNKKQRIFLYLFIWAGFLISAVIFFFKAHILVNGFEVAFLAFYIGLIVFISGTMIELLILLYRRRLCSFVEKRNHKKAWLNLFVLVTCLSPIIAYVLGTILLFLIVPMLREMGLF